MQSSLFKSLYNEALSSQKLSNEIYENYRKSLNLLGSMIPAELHAFLAQKIEKKNEKLEKSFKNNKLRKLANLKEKFGTGTNSDIRKNM